MARNVSGSPAARAWVRLPSGRRLDLLAPTPLDWTDEDLAIGLAHTYRWGGHSVWPGAPLSVAQHSLTVLALRQEATDGMLGVRSQLRELLHDADEGLINFDCISPLKPFLGPGFAALEQRLGLAVAQRYGLAAWTPEEKRAHKRADIAAAAAEAVFVAGWTKAEVREALGIKAAVRTLDPVARRYGVEPWRPWSPEDAAARFLAELRRLLG
jgi:5'-deoxynucleotidase YfbR-like HD superfamily hydrolase